MFSGLYNVNDVKSRYRQMCFVCHPDTGGSDEAMKELNRMYREALERCDGSKSMGDDGKERTYRYNPDVEQGIMDKINELLHLRLTDVQILLVGYWVWITGNTRPVKEKLKEAQCRWHGKRGMWYWHDEGYRTHYSKADFGNICAKYGVQRVEDNERSLVVTG